MLGYLVGVGNTPSDYKLYRDAYNDRGNGSYHKNWIK